MLTLAFAQLLWTFSEILEAFAVLPQLLLLRQTTVPTVIDSFYLLTLGSYRAFYILNWIVRGAVEDNYLDPIPWIFGTIQTAFFVDFAWVYLTRQRVKLRHGGVVDSDDLSRGWLINKFVGRQSREFDEEDAVDSGDARGTHAERRQGGRWGARGISVSADDTLHEAQRTRGQDETQGLTDPDAFEDDLDDDADDALPKHATSSPRGSDDGHVSGVSGGEEWRENAGK